LNYRDTILCVVAVCFAVGCQTQRITSDGRPLPPPTREAPTTPSTARANRMAFMVGSKPGDINNNGFPDLIRVTVALFSAPHPTSIREDGAFVFTLVPQGQQGQQDAKSLGAWRIEGDEVTRGLSQAQYGPCYQFQLSLLEGGGTDRLELDRADLVCVFEPIDGSPPVKSDGVRTIQIGRRLAAQ